MQRKLLIDLKEMSGTWQQVLHNFKVIGSRRFEYLTWGDGLRIVIIFNMSYDSVPFKISYFLGWAFSLDFSGSICSKHAPRCLISPLCQI